MSCVTVVAWLSIDNVVLQKFAWLYFKNLESIFYDLDLKCPLRVSYLEAGPSQRGQVTGGLTCKYTLLSQQLPSAFFLCFLAALRQTASPWHDLLPCPSLHGANKHGRNSLVTMSKNKSLLN